MGRTISLLGMVIFTFGVVALSSLTRPPRYVRLPASPRDENQGVRPRLAPQLARRVLPAYAYDAPFSLN